MTDFPPTDPRAATLTSAAQALYDALQACSADYAVGKKPLKAFLVATETLLADSGHRTPMLGALRSSVDAALYLRNDRARFGALNSAPFLDTLDDARRVASK